MEKTAIAFGTFDGLHLGHIAVLKDILGTNLKPVALSFSVPPKYNKNADGNLIMTLKEKEKAFFNLGITPIFMDFNKVKDISPTDFLEKVLKKYSPCLISTGYDFRFGKNASGDCKLMKQFLKEHNIIYKMTPPVSLSGQPVSSSKIRNEISLGNMEQVSKMLGRPFSFENKVIRGDQRGRTIGFPTINQAYPKELVLPKLGVYESVTEFKGRKYKSITNIGHRPTYLTDKVLAETYIFDFNGDIYGENAKVGFIKFLREEKKFNSLQELKNAIEADKNLLINKF